MKNTGANLSRGMQVYLSRVEHFNQTLGNVLLNLIHIAAKLSISFKYTHVP